MDPVTITRVASIALSAAKSAWDVGSTLYVFFQKAKRFDRTAQAFADEVKSLGMACEVVSIRLGTLVRDLESRHKGSLHATSQSSQLWRCLENQLSGCQKTIVNLKEAVSVTEQSKEGQGFFIKAIKQIGLNNKAAEIAEARNRIRSHTASLQTVLITIGM